MDDSREVAQLHHQAEASRPPSPDRLRRRARVCRRRRPYVFYYRVQSPVLIAELDHHCGVFLDYDTPKPFHIHTVLRTPHGNDYGRAYVRAWQEHRSV
ncbi:DUF3500 domain-containing protein [Streptomyces sp. NBC_01728]|uniref:DUF3500 domain-containing protein n=1 Tax=unclassified Streptomyces TaxID=2593676 RepID=UPI0022511192|nr:MULTISPECIES: DUF3500 domain-containing protein [unclassified Streptomyces]MCX4460261.1 DUF3500 domain-containing protein [Streptomyces sp. NBC_01719]MCX4500408.1 DUF3500 domain-containing protein [Streptomyces sp. NBC_01728]MCX4598116.1 DUF3500 domain-containing protein [Streptomyces sp. NBC_01549]